MQVVDGEGVGDWAGAGFATASPFFFSLQTYVHLRRDTYVGA